MVLISMVIQFFPWTRLPIALVVICLSLALSSCGQGAEAGGIASLPATVVREVFPTATFTPFQAASPTPRPSATVTATELPPAQTATTAPTASLTTTPAQCTENRGMIESFEISSLKSSRPVGFRVYTPPCYDNSGETRYPVLYMIHGQTYNDDQWDRLGLDEAADHLIAKEDAPPFLIVMPLERNTFEDIYVTSFDDDLTDNLIPWIDANYPTCAEHTCRAIGGLSRGGAWALRLGFTRWDLFGSIGLHSTPPFIGDPNQFPYWLREIPPEQMPRVYMDTGRADWYIRPTSEFEAQLVQYNVPHEWYLFNGTHEEAYWAEHVDDYLNWYIEPWRTQE